MARRAVIRFGSTLNPRNEEERGARAHGVIEIPHLNQAALSFENGAISLLRIAFRRRKAPGAAPSRF